MGINLLGDGARIVAVLAVVLGLVGGTVATTLVLERRWLHAAKNALVLVLSCALVLLGVALELNRENAWYPTLADALGTSSEVGASTVVGARSASQTFGTVAVTTTDDRRLPALPSPGQRLQAFQTRTGAGQQLALRVLLPEGYFDARNAHRAYPVLVFAHGIPGTVQTWGTRMDVAKNLDPLVDSHTVGAFIAVMPEVSPSGMDTECELGPHGNTEMEQYLAEGMPAFVRAHLRTMPQREAWAWVGYSAGGWCSAMMAMLHPQQFGGAVVLGGYFRPWWGVTKPSWPLTSPQEKRLDLEALAHNSPPRVALFVQSATHDSESWGSTRRFLAKARAPMFINADIYPTGGHSFELWQPSMVKGVGWLGSTLPGFSPQA